DHDTPCAKARGGLDAEADGDTELAEALREGCKRGPRVEVCLIPEIQALAEAARQIRLECRERIAVQALEVRGTARELRELCGVAGGCHDQGAVRDGARKVPAPPRQALRAEARNERLGAFELAPGREHPAGEPGARRRAKCRAPLEHLDGGAALGELEGTR